MLSIYVNKFIFSKSKLINFSIFLIFILPISITTGPFIPDFIISLIGLIGLILYLKKTIKVVFYKEIIFLWLFYIYLIISSINSEDIIYSLDYSLFYFRFIIFAHFVIYLVARFPAVTKLLLYGIIISLILISISSIYQIINLYYFDIEIDGVRRLELPFIDEAVVGSFIIRTLPILIYTLVINFNALKKFNLKILLFPFILILILIIIFSGERTALLLLLIFTILIFFTFFKLNKKISILLFTFFLISLSFFIYKNDQIKKRVFQDFERNISSDFKTNPYFSYAFVSLKMFQDGPLLGLGPKMFRVYCDNYMNKIDSGYCNLHPHNTYFQLISETGLIGFLFILTAYIYVISFFLKEIFSKNTNLYILFSSIPVIINFFPFVPSGNFFDNWLNSLYYISVILLIYSLNTKSKLNVNEFVR